jgi:hypothetical protein
MNLRLFKNHSGNSQGKFEAEVYCSIYDVSKFSAATQPEGDFQQALSLQEINMTWKLFKNHCGKAQGENGGRSVAVSMSSSNWPQQRRQNGFFNSFPPSERTC